MCCLRYEQEAYEDLIKKVPKQGAFVETKDGYGTAVQVNLLRQTVKVKLDDDGGRSPCVSYKPNELYAVPGGRPEGREEAGVGAQLCSPEPVEETEEEDPRRCLCCSFPRRRGEVRLLKRARPRRRGPGRDAAVRRKPRQPRE